MSYATEVLADSPLGWWRFGEGAGTALIDSSGNGHSGTYASSGVVYGQDSLLQSLVPTVDTAVRFDGVDGRAAVPYGSWMNALSLSGEAWVCMDPAARHNSNIIANRDGAGLGTRPWSMLVDVGGGFRVLIFDAVAGIGEGQSTIADVGDGCAHHVGFSWDNTIGDLRLYVDGTLDTQVSLGVVMRTSTDELQIAYNNDTFHGNLGLYNGILDELSLYDHVLSANRFAAHYRAGPPVECGTWTIGSIRMRF